MKFDHFFHSYRQILPVVVWMLITAATVLMNWVYLEQTRLYEFLSHLSGIGLLWLPDRIHQGLKENWSNYTIGCLFGLVAYCGVNALYTLIYFAQPEAPETAAAIYVAFTQCVALVGAACFGVLLVKRIYKK